MARSRGGGPRRGGRQTIRGRGNGRSSPTVLTGHKYGEAGKVNRRRLRRERHRRGREAHFSTSDSAAALLRQRQEVAGVREGWSRRRRWERRKEEEGAVKASGIMEFHVCSCVHTPQLTDLHAGRDVGQGETLQVRQQAGGDGRRLGGAGGSRRNWTRAETKQGVKTSC